MVKEIKEERVIKLLLGKLYPSTGIDSHMDYYFIDDITPLGVAYSNRIANVNKSRKIIFIFTGVLPFYNKKAHSLVMDYFSNYTDYTYELFSVDRGIINIGDLL